MGEAVAAPAAGEQRGRGQGEMPTHPQPGKGVPAAHGDAPPPRPADGALVPAPGRAGRPAGSWGRACGWPAIRAELGELDAACTVASELLESCRTLGSLRITRQLDDLAQTLKAFQTERPVADLLDLLTLVNQQRSLLLAGITPAHSGGITS